MFAERHLCERAHQPVEVVLVVPRPDGRPQPGAAGNVTHDHPAFAQVLALALGLGALERHERGVPARRHRAAALAQQRDQPAGQLPCAFVHGGPAAPSSTRAAASAHATVSALSDIVSSARASA